MTTKEMPVLDSAPEPKKTGPDQKRMRAVEIARKIRSFDHFLYVWGERGGYYLPPKRCLTWQYVAQLLSREKRLLRAAEVGQPVELPRAKGLVVAKLFEFLKGLNGFGEYFPDGVERRAIPRTYFFNVG